MKKQYQIFNKVNGYNVIVESENIHLVYGFIRRKYSGRIPECISIYPYVSYTMNRKSDFVI